MVVIIHHGLDLALIIETRNLLDSFAVLVPEAVNRALARSLLPLGVFAALTLRLLRCDLYRVRPAIWFLFRFLLFVCSAQILRHNTWVLVQSGIRAHRHAITRLTGCELSVLIGLIVDVAQG